MTSSNGSIFRVTRHLCREFTGHRWFPAQRPVAGSFDDFFDLRLNKRLSKHSWCCWFETPSCPLWRHCNEFVITALGNGMAACDALWHTWATMNINIYIHICVCVYIYGCIEFQRRAQNWIPVWSIHFDTIMYVSQSTLLLLSVQCVEQ